MTDEEIIKWFSCTLIGKAFSVFNNENMNPEQVGSLYKSYLESQDLLDDADTINQYGYWELLKCNRERFSQIMQNPRIPARLKIPPPQNEPERNRTSNGYVYLMKCERTGRVKIGRSKKPTCREKTLQSENPDVVLTHKWKTSPEKEAWLHASFAEKRYRGEWFDLDAADIATIEELMGEQS